MNKKENPKEKAHFSIDPLLHKEFIKHIDENLLSKSRVIENLIKEYMEKIKK